jgi:RNA polymerase sigma factor (sigma-70 family)
MASVSPQQLAELYRTHGPALTLFARQWCDGPEDVVQEAFLALMRQDRCQFPLAWLYRVVRNRAINASRSRSRRRRREAVVAETGHRWFEDRQPQLLDARTATRMLEQLPVEQREVIVARLWGGLNFEQIGELVGTSTSSAFRRFQAGLAKLRLRLEANSTSLDARQRRP